MLISLSTSGRPVPIVNAGDGATLIVNRDLTNQVAYGSGDIVGSNINAYSIIDPLGSIVVDGNNDVYVLALSGTPTIDVVAGAAQWTASPAQVAQQINALGLAKDATVQGVAKDATVTGVAKDTTLGTLAKDATVAKDTTVTAVAGHTSGVQTAGGLQSTAIRLSSAGTFTILTGKAYIYAAWMSWSFVGNASVAAILTSEAVAYITSTNQPIIGAAGRITTPNQALSSSNSIALPGLILAAGDTISLFMPPTPTNSVQVVSCGLIYTTSPPP